MKSFRIISLAAFSMLAFAACQQAEIAPEETPDATHTVTFVAGAPETKTTVTIKNSTANFEWTKADEGRITVYENGVKATETKGVLQDGLMSIKATFAGTAPEGENTYVATLNTSNGGQIMSAEAYDEGADILVSKPVTSFVSDKGMQLEFKREVAIAKMTLKGLDAGEVVNTVTVSSTADIAGSYGVEGWASPAKSLEISSASYKGVTNGYSIVASDAGEAVVWFTCIPQTAATLTVKVEAADGDTYTKEFSKAITLTRGDVKGFRVAMTKDAKDLSFDFKTHPSGWPTSKTAASSAANYVYSLNGIDYTFSCPKEAYCGGTTETSGYLLIPSSSAMGLPAISGYKLVKVVGTLNDSGSPSTSSSISITDGENIVSGGTAKTWSTKGAEYTYSLTDTEEGQVYYFTVSNKNCQMIKLVLTYEPAFARPNLATPTNLAVSAEKVVSWDAVDGAASYVLTIGTKEYPCTSNSYDASAIKDEYYDVAVVAVPTDTENYKNSAAATLTDAKFGTPTLATPTLKEGSVDESSVNTTWTVDSRATAGYNCELYSGETKVGGSKTVNTGSVTFDGLDDGITYTVKVNAIAVEGAKAYAASDVATIDLTTKGTVTLSQITEAGKYTVKNVTVYAKIGTSTAVIGDGTAYFYMYKSNHGLDVGNTFTIGGDVVVYSTYGGILEFSSPTITNKVTGSAPVYKNPVEANEEYLTSYASAPVTEYIHAKGTQSGRSITVGSKKLNLSANNTTTDGKDVEVYGFVYGYNSSNSYAYFYATSIVEDPTVPKLSVTPTSKTWESVEVDAATFKVTTNTEGQKDWSVSPETLDWADITVDKTAGTITVTPKDANTNKTPREATLTVTHSADNSLTEIIKLTQKATGSTGGEIVTLFTEGFGNNIGSARVWSDTYKEQGGIESVYSKSKYTITNAKQSKNTMGNTNSALVQTTTGKDAVFEVKSLDVSGYSDLTVSYFWKAGSIKGTYSTSLYYSIDDGVTYTEVEKDSGTGANSFVEVKYTLPAAAVSSNLCLKVIFNTSNAQAHIDELVLKGKN